MGKNNCNWRGLDTEELELNIKYAKATKELTDCIDEAKKTKIQLKSLKIKKEIDRVKYQIQWANNLLTSRSVAHPMGNDSWTAAEIIHLVVSKKQLDAKTKVIITDLQDGWRQAKKGPVETIEVTKKCKEKLEKLANKNGLYMKEYATDLILGHAKNEDYKSKFESVTKQLAHSGRKISSNTLELDLAYKQITKLTEEYKKLLLESTTSQVRYDGLSTDTNLPELTTLQHDKIEDKYEKRLSKCMGDFLLFTPNKLKLRD